MQALVGGASVDVSAFLGGVKLTLREILDLNVGDTLRLNKVANDVVVVSIDNKERYLATVGYRGYRKTIRIKEVIQTEKDRVKEVLEVLENQRKVKIGNIKEEEE
ncbi:Flagellar motor switch protein FliM [Helicobacter bizzozeronii CCUG 35545]|nr:Flagellar motor switch protein FliM [Helicobacter bizzozeronii CCUG 35545]